MSLTIGSLFTGYSGLDLGVFGVLPDARLIWHSDVKPAACKLMAFRAPGLPNLGDIRKINPADVPPVDVLTFGWPCQPFSAAGKRLGEADPRALWPEVARLIAGLRPRYLFGENVARIASNGELGRVVLTLAHLGYVGTYRTLRASDIGAPHRRDRLGLFAVRADVAADPDNSRLWVGRGRGPGGEETLLPANSGENGRDGLILLPTPLLKSDAGPRGGTTGYGLRNWAKEISLLPTPTVADARNGRNATAGRTPENDRHHSGWTLSDVAYADRWGKYAAAIQRWEHVLRRPAPEPTQLGPRGGFQLAPRFVEWMQGLPAGWVTDVPDLTRNEQLSLLGDGVVPQWATAVFTELIGRFSIDSKEVAS